MVVEAQVVGLEILHAVVEASCVVHGLEGEDGEEDATGDGDDVAQPSRLLASLSPEATTKLQGAVLGEAGAGPGEGEGEAMLGVALALMRGCNDLIAPLPAPAGSAGSGSVPARVVTVARVERARRLVVGVRRGAEVVVRLVQGFEAAQLQSFLGGDALADLATLLFEASQREVRNAARSALSRLARLGTDRAAGRAIFAVALQQWRRGLSQEVDVAQYFGLLDDLAAAVPSVIPTMLEVFVGYLLALEPPSAPTPAPAAKKLKCVLDLTASLLGTPPPPSMALQLQLLGARLFHRFLFTVPEQAAAALGGVGVLPLCQVSPTLTPRSTDNSAPPVSCSRHPATS